MRALPRPSGPLATLLALALGAWGAPDAMQSPEAVPSPRDIDNALGRMLTYADAPALLDVAPGWEFTVKADKSLRQALCAVSDGEIGGPPAALLYQVELGETDATPDPVSTEQKVWQYPSRAQARRDWLVILRRARLCRGEYREPDGAGGSLLRQVSHGRTVLKVQQEAGLWIWSRVEANGPADAGLPDGGYYVFYLVGDSIHSVEYDYRDEAGLSHDKMAAIEALAHRLAWRWLGERWRSTP